MISAHFLWNWIFSIVLQDGMRGIQGMLVKILPFKGKLICMTVGFCILSANYHVLLHFLKAHVKQELK